MKLRNKLSYLCNDIVCLFYTIKSILKSRYYICNWFKTLKDVVKHKGIDNMDKSVIPKDTPYCYTFEGDKYKCCPYYRPLAKYVTYCKYLNHISDDDVFADQCKICNVEFDREY